MSDPGRGAGARHLRQGRPPTLVPFARLTGFRLHETLIEWKHVKDHTIERKGKGGRIVKTVITPQVRAILDQSRGHQPVSVFTYVCTQTQRESAWTAIPDHIRRREGRLEARRERAGVEDFRFHDIRHDVATKLLRATGNLKLVSKQLNHSSIQHTVKYAATSDEDLHGGMSQLPDSLNFSPTISPTKPKKVA